MGLDDPRGDDAFALPPPGEVHEAFARLLQQDGMAAARYLYDLGVGSGYIHPETIEQNPHWRVPTRYGDLEVTINATKPEKDPRDIAKAASADQGEGSMRTDGLHEPLCDICVENETWPGSPDHPAKPGLRIGPIELGGEEWGFQYSPYGYFEEHCIALSSEHRPMSIDAGTIRKLFDFVDMFPDYFIGSNADLPIVGGSILGHDHFQGGRHRFPLMDAPIQIPLEFPHPDVEGGIVAWPASVIRLISKDATSLISQTVSVMDGWRVHDDPENGILSNTGVPHNSLDPILHREGDRYVLDLVLRNNRTDAEHPWGIFHPGEELHHLKRENIGLIEIMGMAILPPRLLSSLPLVAHHIEEALHGGRTSEELHEAIASDEAASAHADWATGIYRMLLDCNRSDGTEEPHPGVDPLHGDPMSDGMRDRIDRAIEQGIGKAFEQVLEATAVFPDDDEGRRGFLRFLSGLGIEPKPQSPRE